MGLQDAAALLLGDRERRRCVYVCVCREGGVLPCCSVSDGIYSKEDDDAAIMAPARPQARR